MRLFLVPLFLAAFHVVLLSLFEFSFFFFILFFLLTVVVIVLCPLLGYRFWLCQTCEGPDLDTVWHPRISGSRDHSQQGALGSQLN